jgi:tellurium resistance protein TerZ
MVKLTKGAGVSLSKDGRDLAKVTMGLGWDQRVEKRFMGFGGSAKPKGIDLDASAILFDASANVVDIVYFGAKRSKDGSIQHTGDNVTGEGEGDDEQIRVDLSRVDQRVQSIVFTVSSFQNDTFDKIENAKCRLLDDKDVEFASYDLSNSGSHTAQIMAKVTREGSGWRMTAIGETAMGRTAQQLAGVAARHA